MVHRLCPSSDVARNHKPCAADFRAEWRSPSRSIRAYSWEDYLTITSSRKLPFPSRRTLWLAVPFRRVTLRRHRHRVVMYICVHPPGRKIPFHRVRKTTSRTKYQQQKHCEQQQVNAALQDTRFAAAESNDSHGQGE